MALSTRQNILEMHRISTKAMQEANTHKNGEIVESIGIHSHSAESEKIEVRKDLMKIVKLAKSTTDSNQVIIVH